MTPRRPAGYFIGGCGHRVPSGPLFRTCPCDANTTSPPRPAGIQRRSALLFERLAATVEELAVLRAVVTLADEAPKLTDAELRDRLTALARR